MASSRRPSNTITSCIFYNTKENGVWKSMSFNINDWVTMLPSCKGAHRVKRTKREDIKNHWKGRILAFRVTNNGWLAKVQHVFLTKDMMLDSALYPPVLSYYVFPSTSVEWQPVESLSGTFQAIHKEVADAMYPNQPPSFFNRSGLFVYFAEYKVPLREGAFGDLEDLPGPSLGSSEWGDPDLRTITSFKARFEEDIQKAMAPGRISRRIRVQWFVPIHIFVACFKSMDLQRTRTMWLNRRLLATEVDSVLGVAWRSRETFHIGDNIRCTVSPNSLSISYQISRQSLVLGFDYRRWRRKLGNWLPLDSEENCPEFKLRIQVSPFPEPKMLIVTANWTLKDVRESLEFLDETGPDYKFKINGVCVSNRSENTIFCFTCLPPKILLFEPMATRGN